MTSLLPLHFQFSQGSLQDYVDCPRRFQLRHIWEQPWPAAPSEPLAEHERYIELGRRFHQLIEQHIAGLPVETLTAAAHDPDLARWWRNYLNAPPPGVLGLPVRRAEAALSAPVRAPAGEYRLMARYDLLALDPGRRAVIVDWKTERRQPLRAHLAARLQTRVYRYVLVEAGHVLNGGQPVAPEHVDMIYWFAEFPAEQIFSYDALQYDQDKAYLTGLIAEIAARTDEVFPLTADEHHCKFCVYRSLCKRGAAAATSAPGEQDIEQDLDFDWAEIQEIAY